METWKLGFVARATEHSATQQPVKPKMSDQQSSAHLVDQLTTQDQGQKTTEKGSYDLFVLPTKEDAVDEIKETGVSLP
jgi:hypothetical protein